jgi:hypothetical protein
VVVVVVVVVLVGLEECVVLRGLVGLSGGRRIDVVTA